MARVTDLLNARGRELIHSDAMMAAAAEELNVSPELLRELMAKIPAVPEWYACFVLQAVAAAEAEEIRARMRAGDSAEARLFAVHARTTRPGRDAATQPAAAPLPARVAPPPAAARAGAGGGSAVRSSANRARAERPVAAWLRGAAAWLLG